MSPERRRFVGRLTVLLVLLGAVILGSWLALLPAVPVIELRLNLPIESFAGEPIAVRDLGNGVTKLRIADGEPHTVEFAPGDDFEAVLARLDRNAKVVGMITGTGWGWRDDNPAVPGGETVTVQVAEISRASGEEFLAFVSYTNDKQPHLHFATVFRLLEVPEMVQGQKTSSFSFAAEGGVSLTRDQHSFFDRVLRRPTVHSQLELLQ